MAGGFIVSFLIASLQCALVTVPGLLCCALKHSIVVVIILLLKISTVVFLEWFSMLVIKVGYKDKGGCDSIWRHDWNVFIVLPQISSPHMIV